MKKELYIYIPEPCHEDWNKMTPAQQGRFCQSCCKEVIDFSMMTDREIINFLSKSQTKTCGNFSTEQLNRPIKEPATPAKKKLWAMMLSFLLPLFAWNKSKAQMGLVAVHKVPAKCNVKGDTVIANTLFTLEGKIKDSVNNAIPFATIKIKGSKYFAVADSAGLYTIKNIPFKEFIISVSSVGYKTVEVNMSCTKQFNNKDLSLIPAGKSLTDVEIKSFLAPAHAIIQKDITLQPQINTLENVSVSQNLSIRLGGAYVTYKRISYSKKIKDTIVHLLDPVVKLYPNPAIKGTAVNVQLTNIGIYYLKLVDNNGKLIQQNSFSIINKKEAYQMQLPETIASGIYFINVIDEKTKKQYTQKLIVR